MIEIVTDKNIDEVLPLVHEYQVFYGVGKIDDEKNKSFFSQFTKSHENGVCIYAGLIKKRLVSQQFIKAIQVQGLKSLQY